MVFILYPINYLIDRVCVLWAEPNWWQKGQVWAPKSNLQYRNMDHLDACSNYFNGLPAVHRLPYTNKLTFSNGVRCPDPCSLSGPWVKDPTKRPKWLDICVYTLLKNPVSIRKENSRHTNLFTHTNLHFAVMSRTFNTKICPDFCVLWADVHTDIKRSCRRRMLLWASQTTIYWRQTALSQLAVVEEVHLLLEGITSRIFLKKRCIDSYKNNPSIIPALCLYFLILLCTGRFWASTFGQWRVAPSQ